MLKAFSKLILRIFGWKEFDEIPHNIRKAVVIVAPHTSTWDFVIGRFAYWALGFKPKFLIKSEMFVFPMKGLLNWVGGIPVNRNKSGNMVENVANLFSKYDSLFITITPEGTRRLNPNWKKGFYYIALKAQVPIVIGILDYKKKIAGFSDVFYPTGDFEKDFKNIEDYYRERAGKHPENFNLK